MPDAIARVPQVPDVQRAGGGRLSPLMRRRLRLFKANRRGFWSLWIFLALFTVSLFSRVRPPTTSR